MRACLLALLLLLPWPSLAADIYTVANGATSTIYELSVCKKVTNNHASGLSLMVPTGSASEWYTGGNSFIEHTPPGVSLGVCTCSLPWGGTINDGSSATAYQASSVTCGNSCVSETRTCTGNVLSGSYQYSSCSVGSCCLGSGASCSSNGQCCSGVCNIGSHGGHCQ